MCRRRRTRDPCHHQQSPRTQPFPNRVHRRHQRLPRSLIACQELCFDAPPVGAQLNLATRQPAAGDLDSRLWRVRAARHEYALMRFDLQGSFHPGRLGGDLRSKPLPEISQEGIGRCVCRLVEPLCDCLAFWSGLFPPAQDHSEGNLAGCAVGSTPAGIRGARWHLIDPAIGCEVGCRGRITDTRRGSCDRVGWRHVALSNAVASCSFPERTRRVIISVTGAGCRHRKHWRKQCRD